MAKITTGELYNEWQQINNKLELLNNKVDGIIDGSTPANTQVTGSNLAYETFENVVIDGGATFVFNENIGGDGSLFRIVVLSNRGDSYRLGVQYRKANGSYLEEKYFENDDDKTLHIEEYKKITGLSKFMIVNRGTEEITIRSITFTEFY